MAFNVNSLEGNELADGYERAATGDQGRWSATWQIFKGSFGKLVLLNILMLLFCTPAIVIVVLRTAFVGGYGSLFPFNGNTGIGYPAYPNMEGLTESLYLYVDLIFYSALIGAGLIAAIGFSGGAYSIKKILSTNGTYKFKDFFHGIKVGYFKTLLPVALFLIFYFTCVIIGDWKDWVIAQGGASAGPVTAYVFIIIATVLVGIYCAWLLAVGISYRLKFSQLLKNAFVLMVNQILPTVLIAIVALLPVWVYLLGMAWSFFTFIAWIFFLLIGFSYIVTVWMSFTQWAFDLYVTPKFKTEETSKKKKVREVVEEEEQDEKSIARQLLAAGRSELIGKPVLPISEQITFASLGKTFTRADFNKLESDKQKLYGEIEAYEKQHANDPVYAEYNKLFADREKALQEPKGKKGKKKRVSSQNLLR